ncbi:MAG TPA: DUF1097 domain-containing protein [Steroidobacteraceae bacterium]
MRYHLQTVSTAFMAAAAAGLCAGVGWPVWAMFLGWVASLIAGDAFKDIFRSYCCLAMGVTIGAAGLLSVAALSPMIGALAYAVTVFGMATLIVSTRQMPFANVVPSYILGVVGMFALHPELIGAAAVKIAAPGAVGSISVWLASRLRKRIANLPQGNSSVKGTTHEQRALQSKPPGPLPRL